ncbi:MAG: NADH-quinone oxidoreductase subunit K [Campylobacterota bacterium]|nr:NADH-quinone oxidoreductase subunit K [Campylobacterota bacterium]
MFEFLNQSETIKIIVIIGSMTLFFIGLFGLLTRKHFIKIFMSIAIMETSVFLLFIGLTFDSKLIAPIVHVNSTPMNDPIPHAMILTAIVIAMAVLALGVSFAIEYFKLTGKTQIDEMTEMRH